jgi:hypothetical protein
VLREFNQEYRRRRHGILTVITCQTAVTSGAVVALGGILCNRFGNRVKTL